MNIYPGTRIKELRTLFGMSQEELGRRIGVQRAAINKYEKGTVTNIPIQTIERIAHTFDVSPNYIVGWDDLNTNPLAVEVKLLQGIKNIYGSDVVELLESYIEVTKVGRNKIKQYANDIWKIHRK
jgi:transcriptional regulator with XRE-family HTH domain